MYIKSSEKDFFIWVLNRCWMLNVIYIQSETDNANQVQISRKSETDKSITSIPVYEII